MTPLVPDNKTTWEQVEELDHTAAAAGAGATSTCEWQVKQAHRAGHATRQGGAGQGRRQVRACRDTKADEDDQRPATA